MLIWATRRLPQAVARALILVGLFVLVVVLQIAFTSGFRAAGLPPGYALGASGICVLGAVLLLNWRYQEHARRRVLAYEAARLRQGLPDGPCCVVWRGASGAATGSLDMPWELIDDIRIVYPRVAKALGVEGVAVIEFEVGADGAAKNLHCLDSWPSAVFYNAAAAALGEARFQLRWGAEARFGASYRMPFVFRIAGAAQIREEGRRARAQTDPAGRRGRRGAAAPARLKQRA